MWNEFIRWCVLRVNQTLKQEKRIKSMGTAVPGFTHTVLLLGGGECQPSLCPSVGVCVEVSFNTKTT